MLALHKFNTFSLKLRWFSSNTNLIQVTLDEKTNIANAALQRPPVNSLNTSLLSEIKSSVEKLEKTKCKGLILTSNIPGIFCAGLDLTEFYKPDIKKLEIFWTTLQDTWLKLYTTSLPVVALINGHSPAGGCLLAMSCDYRVMIGSQFTIGLNEAKIGIPAPFWFMDIMSSLIGSRKTEISVLLGKMYKTDEALEIGLVDELATDLSDANSKIDFYLRELNTAPVDCRAAMKKEFRGDIVQKFLHRKNEEVKVLVELITHSNTQKKFELYFDLLKKK